jgi:hypothetical protein
VRSIGMTLSRSLITSAAVGAVLIAPSAAHAAQGFTGVTSAGQITTFQSDSAPGIESSVPILIPLAGERVVGMDRAPHGELWVLTSGGYVGTISAKTGHVFLPVRTSATGPIDPDGPLSFAVAPDGVTARIITPGRDVTVVLATGQAVSNAPALGFAPGDPNAGTDPGAAVDYGADGRLVGVASARGAFTRETAPGSALLSTGPATPFTVAQPVRSTVAADGDVYTVSALQTGRPAAPPQSRFVRYDPATGRITGQNGVYLGQQYDAIAALGTVPDDKTAPKATISGRALHRRVTHGVAYYTGVSLKVDEGGQTTASVRLRGKVVGFGLVSADASGTGRLEIVPRKGASPALKAAAAHGRKVVLHLTVHDWAGNKRVYDRAVSVAR